MCKICGGDVLCSLKELVRTLMSRPGPVGRPDQHSVPLK